MLSIGMLMMSGCGSDGEGGDAATAGVLRVGVQTLPPGQGNPFSAVGSPSIYTWSPMFDALTVVNANGEPAPALARKWASTSRTTWTFTLRSGLRFSDGEKLDAAAVVATFDYLHSDPGRATVVGKELLTLSASRAVSATEVEFTTAAPDPILPNRIATMYIVAPKAWAERGPGGFAASPVGSGSYQVESWNPGKVTFTGFNGSWRRPVVPRLEITEIGEPAARLQALQSGQLDLVLGLSPDQQARITAAGATVQVTPAPQVMSLAFVTTRGSTPLSDRRVRQALNYAVDKNSIVDNVMAGLGRPASQGATPGAFGYAEDVKPYPYDPAKARRLLAEAGVGSGFALPAEVVVGTYPADAEIYQAMAADLAKVGVRVTLRQVQFAAWLDKYTKGTWDTPAFGLSWNTAPILDASRPYALFSCAKTPAFFCDEAVMPLQAKASTEFDTGRRATLLADLARAAHDNPPSLLLVEQIDLNATAGGVKGYHDVNRVINYHELTVGS
ncbi:ABC transporter substrate-binding protein [Actinophytocola sp.]|uniref:ABC transporter substrate-binding protein n=1 Tax=Actinophytocola sp. TaxID=1872138 RepID=UPI00389B2C05